MNIGSQIKNNDIGYGIDVALRRADDLDRRLLNAIRSDHDVSVLDVGCGAGGQSLRMVEAGASVCGLDIQDYSQEFEVLRTENNYSTEKLQFIKGSMKDLSKLVGDRRFDLACFQRTVHYSPYLEAVEVLKGLHQITNQKLYISASGLNTYFKEYYKDKDKNIAERFCCLTPEGAEKFNIKEPLCLYTKKELVNLLLLSGWLVEEVWVSDFGNVKAICSKT